MSYYAHGLGDLVLQDKNTVIPKELDRELSKVFDTEYYKAHGSNVMQNMSLEFDGDYNSLDELKLLSTLNALNPYISYGAITFESEDDNDAWKYQYNPKTNSWKLYEGRTVYANETGLTDRENKIFAEALTQLDTPEARNILKKYWASFATK